MTKHKHFWDTTPAKIRSNSNRLVGETNDAPIDVDVAVLQEDDDDDPPVLLDDIPSVEGPAIRRSRRAKRPRAEIDDTVVTSSGEDEDGDALEAVSNNGNNDGNDDDNDDDDEETPPTKRRRNASEKDGGGDNDDKKKLAMDVRYQGFAIYGRVLCLVVKKKGGPAKGKRADTGRRATGQAVMENWLTSTQMPFGEEDEVA